MVDYGDAPTVPGYHEETLARDRGLPAPRCTRRGWSPWSSAATTRSCSPSCARRRRCTARSRSCTSTPTPTCGTSTTACGYFHGTVFKRAVEEGLVDPGALGAGRDARHALRRAPMRRRRATWATTPCTWPELERRPRSSTAIASGRAWATRRPSCPSTSTSSTRPSPRARARRRWAARRSAQALAYLRALTGIDFRGFDCVEVSPPYDPAGITAWLAASACHEMLSLVARGPGRAEVAEASSPEAPPATAMTGGEAVAWAPAPRRGARVRHPRHPYALHPPPPDRDGIRHVTPRHEQGGGYAADGYARVSGRPGVLVATSGPGVVNAATPIATAYADSVPMLVISPAMATDVEGRDTGSSTRARTRARRSARSPRGAGAPARPPRWSRRSTRPSRSFASGRPRPVARRRPARRAGGLGPRRAAAAGRRRDRISTTTDSSASPRCSRSAERPALVLGGGARGAAAAVVELAERLGAPVVTTVNGKGSCPSATPCPSAPDPAARRPGLARPARRGAGRGHGARRVRPLGTAPRLDGRLVRIDVDPTQLQKNLPASLALAADARAAVAGLLAALPPGRPGPVGAATSSGRARPSAPRRSPTAPSGSRSWTRWPAPSAPRACSAGTTPRPRTTASCTSWRWTRGRFVYPTGYATLGYALPAAIGAKLADPELRHRARGRRRVALHRGRAGHRGGARALPARRRAERPRLRRDPRADGGRRHRADRRRPPGARPAEASARPSAERACAWTIPRRSRGRCGRRWSGRGRRSSRCRRSSSRRARRGSPGRRWTSGTIFSRSGTATPRSRPHRACRSAWRCARPARFARRRGPIARHAGGPASSPPQPSKRKEHDRDVQPGGTPRTLVRRAARTVLPTDEARFDAIAYVDEASGEEHVALVLGDPASDAPEGPPLVRVHSECLTGDALGSHRCDCGDQLAAARRRVAAEGRGVVVYLRGHEGRGIGLADKLRAYALQDRGLDTVDANLALGLPVDARRYGAAAAILADLGVRSLRLMSVEPGEGGGAVGPGPGGRGPPAARRARPARGPRLPEHEARADGSRRPGRPRATPSGASCCAGASRRRSSTPRPAPFATATRRSWPTAPPS